MKKVEYKVVGMTCSGCENSVKRVVSKIDGVESVEANHKLNQVVVSADDLVSEQEIANRISKLGYQVDVKA